MKTKLILATLLLASSAFGRGLVSFGVGFGPAWGYGYGGGYYGGYVAAPRPPAYYAAPGPGYAWVGGYWYPSGPRYAWRPGYWAMPPYARAYWVGPRYYGGRYYRGYWRR
jgi:hypothetical protein